MDGAPAGQLRTSGSVGHVRDDAVDTLGLDGVWWDPLWRVEVRLTPLEHALLTSWPVRRLAFVAHAGGA